MIIDDIIKGIERWDRVVRVTVTHCLGSSPREAGAHMIVAADDFEGSIGGGKLEFLALQQARAMLKKDTGQQTCWPRQTENFVLGTELRQCCGGVVWLLFEYFDDNHQQALTRQAKALLPGDFLIHDINGEGPLLVSSGDMATIERFSILAQALDEVPAGPLMLKDQQGRAQWFIEPAQPVSPPLVIYGAGHVGRALVRVLEGTPFDISWVDINKQRFPAHIREGVKRVIAADPADHARTVEAGAFHVVMTHSHQIDLQICRNVLQTDQSGFLGLIGSETKKTKFLNRLRKDGLSDRALNVFHCPVGLGDWSGKQPSIIAISIAAQLIDEYDKGLMSKGPGKFAQIRAVGGRQ